MAHTDGHDAPRLASEFVPSIAAVIDDVVVAEEDSVRQPVVAHELPDVLDRVEFGTFGWERQEREIFRDGELRGRMPTGLVEHEEGVASRRNAFGDLLQMQLHRLGVALGQDEADRLAFLGADRAEDVGRGGAQVARSRRPRSALRPAAGDLVLLSDARLVGEPDFYGVGADALFARDFLQARREAFLKSSIAVAAWA